MPWLTTRQNHAQQMSEIMDDYRKKEIGINLKFILGNPDYEERVAEVEGWEAAAGQAKIKAPGKSALPEWRIW